MAWKELPDPDAPLTMEPEGQTKRPGLFKRLSSRIKSSSDPSAPTNKKAFLFRDREQRQNPPFGPIRRTSSCSTTSNESESASATSSTPSFGPKGEGFEIPIVSVLDPAGEKIHGHGGDWGDFEEREAIGSGAGGIRTIREKMEMARRSRRPARPTIVIPPSVSVPAPVAQAAA